MFMYTDEILDALKLLRDAGFAVCAFDPEELEGINPDKVEQRMCAAGWDFIEAHTEQSASQP
jgi:hypothetical protein